MLNISKVNIHYLIKGTALKVLIDIDCEYHGQIRVLN
jgi:hypothetical protein